MAFLHILFTLFCNMRIQCLSVLSNSAHPLHHSAKRSVFARLTVLDHLCDPNELPAWHTSLPKDIHCLPEARTAVEDFQKQRYKQCDSALERACEIIENIPQMGPSGVHLMLGRLHCALESNMPLIDPAKWSMFGMHTLQRISEILLARPSNDDEILLQWVKYAALVLHSSEDAASPTLIQHMRDIEQTLKKRDSKHHRRVRFVQSLVSSTTLNSKRAYPEEVSQSAAVILPDIFPEVKCNEKAKSLTSGELLESLSAIAAESFPSEKTNNFSSLYRPSNARRRTQTDIAKKIHDWMLTLQPAGVEVDGLTLPASPVKVDPELFIAMFLSVDGCPLEQMQRALKVGKALPDEKAEAREVLTAMCLRSLALHYQYNYVYFSGLYNKAIQQLEVWLKRSLLGQDAIDAVVNRVMRREYVKLLVDLGQHREAESIKRRYALM